MQVKKRTCVVRELTSCRLGGPCAKGNASSLDSRALTSISELSDGTGTTNSPCVPIVARFRFYGSERSFVIALLLQNICPKNARVELQTIRFDLFKSRESNIQYSGGERLHAKLLTEFKTHHLFLQPFDIEQVIFSLNAQSWRGANRITRASNIHKFVGRSFAPHVAVAR